MHIMGRLRCHFLLSLVLVCQFGIAQKLKRSDEVTLANLKSHIQFLADDKLEGRRTGTKGEAMAMTYIADQFRKDGLQPKGTDIYFQAFDINEGKQVNKGTHFVVNDK